MVFDILHTRARIPEPYATDEPGKAVVPGGFPFSVYKDPKAVLKTESLEAACAALVFERPTMAESRSSRSLSIVDCTVMPGHLPFHGPRGVSGRGCQLSGAGYYFLPYPVYSGGWW